MRLLAFIGAVIVTMLSLHAGLAGERQATSVDLRTTVDPVGTWRVVGRTSATSDCIGDAITPICAVETHMACFDRRIIELCRLSDWPKDFRRYNLNLPGGSDDIYRIDEIKRFDRLTAMQRRLLERDGDKYPSLTRIGDIDVHMRWDECAKNERACRKQAVPGFSCLVRKIDGKWKVIDCSGDGVDSF